MKRLALLAMTACLAQSMAFAAPADGQEDAIIHSERAMLDTARNESVLTGDVSLATPTLQMQGDTLRIETDGEGYKTYTLTAAPGKMATVRKKRSALDGDWMDGEGDKIIYEEKLQRLTVSGKVSIPAAPLQKVEPKVLVDGVPRVLAQNSAF